MQKRFASIWFRYLKTDWFTRRYPHLQKVPFVLTLPDHGRMVVTAVNIIAQQQGIETGMVLADARAIIPCLEYFDDDPARNEILLKNIAEWFIRYTPVVSIDPPEGLLLDITGCAHLWGGEKPYITAMHTRLKKTGYHLRIGVADSIGAAWAISHYGINTFIIETNQQKTALIPLPPAALRIDTDTINRLEKLGLRQVGSFLNMPRASLRRRFGEAFLKKLNQALGYEEEIIQPVQITSPYHERLPCLEPIITRTGIEIALKKLLDSICCRLQQEQKGLRAAIFKCYRIDGKTESIEIGTHRPSCNSNHLFKLFEDKIDSIEPALGIELFILEAPKTEDLFPVQEKLWEHTHGVDDNDLSELLDRIAGKTGTGHIHRYLPDEHYWPERSFKASASLSETPATKWKTERPRPVQLLSRPELIEVTAPIPDYPPMMFRYKGKLHKIIKADGPERIEQEWWLQQGRHRDYYYVEDEEGCRYWLFRSGHYDTTESFQWYIHGFFA